MTTKLGSPDTTATSETEASSLSVLASVAASRRTRADCTVRALANVAGIAYELAENIAADGGRGAGRRFRTDKLIAAAKSHGLTFRKLRMGSRTLRRFLREHPTGRFLARMRGHAFAIVDGAVIDKRAREGSVVLDAWQFGAVQS